jgi:hypothetical protein
LSRPTNNTIGTYYTLIEVFRSPLG